MNRSSLAIYFALLVTLCAVFIAMARLFDQHAAYLAQAYMLTPAVAALVTRGFFYGPRFSDAQLRLGRLADYGRFWLVSIGITALSFLLFTALGAITWDFTGNAFLQRLTRQLAAAGTDINTTLPPGLTPRAMLVIFFVGGLTVFNILPGLITGFGEEFGHRGFMFPLLYRIRPSMGIVVGGLIWYGWHLPLALVVPGAAERPFWEASLEFVVLAIGSVCTFTYLAYVYVKSRSVWVSALAHITMNNSAASFSYFVVVRNQALANVGLAATMALVVATLYWTGELKVFAERYQRGPGERVAEAPA